MDNTFLNIVSIVILIFVYSYVYKKAVLNYYRQNLFELRDRLFRLYFENNTNETISLEEYRYMEALINNQIRFAHHLKLIPSLYIFFKIKDRKRTEPNFKNEFSSFIKNLKTKGKDEYVKVMDDMSSRVIGYLFLSNLFLSLGFYIASIAFLVIRSRKTSKLKKYKEEVKLNTPNIQQIYEAQFA